MEEEEIEVDQTKVNQEIEVAVQVKVGRITSLILEETANLRIGKEETIEKANENKYMD